MVDWTDTGIILSVRPHGETSAIVELLTKTHGRHAGLVRGGRSKTRRGMLQPGNEVRAEWRARLAEHLGAYTLDLIRDRSSVFLDDADRLAGLTAACSLVSVLLPEREPHSAISEGLSALISAIDETPNWPAGLVRFELGVLAELGFGLDLTACAATGTTNDLIFVSPKTGRAVCAEAGSPYKERMLALPGFLRPHANTPPDISQALQGLQLTGYFIKRELLDPHGASLPAARERLIERLKRRTGETPPNRL